MKNPYPNKNRRSTTNKMKEKRRWKMLYKLVI
jgi:hypothetical protein